MNKGNGYRKLGRTSSQRKALLRSQTTDLIVKGEIITTIQKAKEVRRTAENMITLGKKNTLASRRKAAAYMYKADVEGRTSVQYLFSDVAPRYATRNGGYTRITKLGTRRGDNAELAKIELV